MSGEERIIIDAARMFPEAANRKRILEDLKRKWAGIAGRAARDTVPYSLSANELCVVSRNKRASDILMRLQGNIIRALTQRLGCKPAEGFRVRVINSAPKEKKFAEPSSRKMKTSRDIAVKDEEVRQCMNGAPETLPEDINYALSHLRLYMERRFS